jgi:hypothetical protein
VNKPGNQAKCNGENTTTITFTGAVAGTTYNWSNNNTSIGLAASGSGDIASFTAVNNGTTPVVATITVTPVKDGCTGTAQTCTITVNPTPTVNKPADQTKCNGENTDAISFTGAVAGTTYNWSNNNTSIGLAASGSGDIASFKTVNTGTIPVVATITVTPLKDECTGASKSFTITVNPNAPAPNSQIVLPKCDDATMSVEVVGPQNGIIYTISQPSINKTYPPITYTTAMGKLVFTGLQFGAGYKLMTSTVEGCVSSPEECGPQTPSSNQPPVSNLSVNNQSLVSETHSSVLTQTIHLEEAAKSQVQASPNPYNDKVRFALKSAISGQGNLELYNMLGQKVKTVFQGRVEAGQVQYYEYNVPSHQRSNLIYIFRVGDQKVTGKLIH